MEDYTFQIPVHRVAGFLRAVGESNKNARKYPRHFTQMRPEETGRTGDVAEFLLKIRNRRKIMFVELLGYIHDANNGQPLKRTAAGRVHD